MSTGYAEWRAARHDKETLDVLSVLQERGYNVKLLEVSGHMPDISLGRRSFIDVKTSSTYENFSIELNSVLSWNVLAAQGKQVFVVLVDRRGDWFVDTPETLLARVFRREGPHLRSGKGSNDTWVKLLPGGTSFDEFFPVR